MSETLFPLDAPQSRNRERSVIQWSGWPFGELEPGAYQLIMCDPPWSYRMWGEGGYEKSPQAHYECLHLPELMALPVGRLAARDCLLWLWTTWPHLANGDAHRLLSAWGFEGRTGLPWNKKTASGKQAFGPGYIVRACSEPVIFAVRGSPAWDDRFCARTRGTIDAAVREHSRKPDDAYSMAEGFIRDARRADLFARQRRPGWEGWGNELDKFPPVEVPPETPPLDIVAPMPAPMSPPAPIAAELEELPEIPAWLRRAPSTAKLAIGAGQ